MRRLALVSALLAATAAQAAPTLTTHVPALLASHGARLLGAPAPDQRMELSFSLPLRDEAGLRQLLAAMYQPGNPAFHQYLSVPAFTARFGASQADYDALAAFASAHNLLIRTRYANRRVLDVSGRVADIERALHVTLGLYQHPTQARTFMAPDREPALDLAVPVLHITGLDDFTRPYNHLVRGGAGARGARKATGSGPSGNFIGSDIRAAYYGGTALTGAGQSVGLFEYAGYELSDVQLYFTNVKQSLNVPVKGVALNGASLGCTGNCDDSEQVLDIEEAISMAPGLAQLVVYVGNNDVSILNQMAVDNTSKQLSSSWGWGADASTIDPILMEFAAQGQSFVDATGDDGYHLLKDAVWPGDDQWVTGVGGTDLVTHGAGGSWAAEIGWRYSGGGPSPDHIAIPSYQVPFVTTANGGSTTLRNVPDIAGDANTNNYSCYDGGCYTGNGGTSYAAPLWAGFIALVNQANMGVGKPPVGFLNPTLYAIGGSTQYAASFHDQKQGFNGKYHAQTGFDLVTGFGTPHGEATISALIDSE